MVLPFVWRCYIWHSQDNKEGKSVIGSNQGMRIVLRGGWLHCSETKISGIGDLWIRDGKIEAIQMGESQMLPSNVNVIDCTGKWIAPGLVDVCTFCGELGVQHRETFDSLTQAALAGGYTDIVLGPWGEPCVDTPAVVTDLLARSAQYPIRYHALGSLTVGLRGVDLAEMGLMKRAGVIGFCDGLSPIASSVVLRKSLQYAERLDLPVFLTPSDPDLDTEGVMHEGEVSTRIGLPGIPFASEEMSLAKIVSLERDTGARCCALPIGSKDSLAYSKVIDSTVRIGISARSLYLSDQDIEDDLYNPSLHIYPPLRSDPEGLRDLVQSGQVDLVFAHHIPLTRVEQDCEFSMASAGAMGLETALSVAHVQVKDLSLLWEKMCFQPARFLGLSKGLHVGSDLDIVIFDPHLEWTPQTPFQSKGINEPLLGKTLMGRVCATLTAKHMDLDGVL